MHCHTEQALRYTASTATTEAELQDEVAAQDLAPQRRTHKSCVPKRLCAKTSVGIATDVLTLTAFQSPGGDIERLPCPAALPSPGMTAASTG
jgi:hypothetical protein